MNPLSVLILLLVLFPLLIAEAWMWIAAAPPTKRSAFDDLSPELEALGFSPFEPPPAQLDDLNGDILGAYEHIRLRPPLWQRRLEAGLTASALPAGTEAHERSGGPRALRYVAVRGSRALPGELVILAHTRPEQAQKRGRNWGLPPVRRPQTPDFEDLFTVFGAPGDAAAQMLDEQARALLLRGRRVLFPVRAPTMRVQSRNGYVIVAVDARGGDNVRPFPLDAMLALAAALYRLWTAQK